MQVFLIKTDNLIPKDGFSQFLKKLVKIQITCVSLFILLSALLYVNRGAFTFSPWNTVTPIEWASYANGNGERTVIIADSAGSVIVLNTNNELIYRLGAKPDTSESFSAAYFAEFDEDNNLYLLDLRVGGYREENVERVLKYSPKGKFLEELYARRYSNTEFIITKGKISGMAYFDHAVYLARLGDDDITLERASAVNGGRGDILAVIPYPHAFRDIGYIHVNAEKRWLTLTTKAGAIKRYDFNGTLLYTRESMPDSLPNTAVSGGDTDIIYADILTGNIVQINTETNEQTLWLRSPINAYYRINYNGGTLFAAPYDQNTAVALLTGTSHDRTMISRYTYSKPYQLLRVLLFGAAILDGVFFLVSLVSLIVILIKMPKGKSANTLILAGIFIIIGALISSTLISNEMTAQYEAKTFYGLENISRLMTASLDTEVLASISNPTQSESEEYLTFKHTLQTQFSQLQFSGKQVYQTITREQKGMLYLLYDLEGAAGSFYPIAPYDEFYENIVSSKQYEHSQAGTTEGNWLFVCGPILNEQGEVIAFIETGYDLRMVQRQTKNIILWAWILLGLIAAAIFLVLFEFLLIFDYRRRPR